MNAMYLLMSACFVRLLCGKLYGSDECQKTMLGIEYPYDTFHAQHT